MHVHMYFIQGLRDYVFAVEYICMSHGCLKVFTKCAYVHGTLKIDVSISSYFLIHINCLFINFAKISAFQNLLTFCTMLYTIHLILYMYVQYITHILYI